MFNCIEPRSASFQASHANTPVTSWILLLFAFDDPGYP